MMLFLLVSCFRLNWTKEIMCFDTVTDGSTDITNATVTFTGESPNDQAGFSLATGDVDGNGSSDILIGAPGNDEGGTDAGKVYLVLDSSMTDLGIGRTITNLSEASYQFVGDQSETQAGYSLFLGDIDGDEQDDVVIGAPYYDSEGSDSGTVFVFLASSLGDTSTIVLTAANYIITGENEGDSIGNSLSIGDIDGDGKGDLLIGAEDAGSDDGGRAYLFLATTLLSQTDNSKINASEADYTFVEGNAGHRLGASVSNTHDFNEDGLADILIGIPGSNENGLENSGKVALMASSSLEGLVSDERDVVLTHADYSLYGTSKNDELGSFVSLAENRHGDGALFVGTGETAEEQKVYLVWQFTLNASETDDEIPYADVFPGSTVSVGEGTFGENQSILVGADDSVAIGGYFSNAYSEGDEYLFNNAATGAVFSPVPVFGDFNNDGMDEVIIGNPIGTSSEDDEAIGEVYIFVNCDFPLK